jgi:putative transposase
MFQEMRYDPQKHHRRSIRLRDYDYARPGWYFVTICAQSREMVFGNVIHGGMILNTVGKIVDFHWQKLPHHFKNIELDEFQIMPNHFHGIVNIVGAMHSDQNIHIQPLQPPMLHPHGTKPGSLGAIMQNFQSITTRKINHIRKTPGQRLWQRNYYEHIIRDEPELIRIRKYIIENPLKWQSDKYFQ